MKVAFRALGLLGAAALIFVVALAYGLSQVPSDASQVASTAPNRAKPNTQPAKRKPAASKHWHAPIDYDMLLAGKHAPHDAAIKLKRAALLAASSDHCARVSSGFWIPVSQQLASHRNQPWMITCKLKHSPNYYNVYFSDADLASHRVKSYAKPVGKRKAYEICANAMHVKYPDASLKVLSRAYDASKSSGNVVQLIGVTVPNALGTRVDRVVHCIIDPRGHMGAGDIWLTKK